MGKGSGYAQSWVIIRLEDRSKYMAALESASIEGNIVPFANMSATLCVIVWNTVRHFRYSKAKFSTLHRPGSISGSSSRLRSSVNSHRRLLFSMVIPAVAGGLPVVPANQSKQTNTNYLQILLRFWLNSLGPYLIVLPNPSWKIDNPPKLI